MRFERKRLFAAALVVTLALPGMALATNGYMAIGYGLKAKGMGGVATPFPQEAQVGATNPDGVARLGSTMDAFLELFVPPREVAGQGIFNLDTQGGVKSNDNFFPIPGFGMTFEVSEQSTYGISFVGNGANTSYNHNNFFDLTGTTPPRPYGILGVELIQMQILPIWAYKINQNHAIGVSPVIGLQVFKAYGLGNFSQDQFQFTSDSSKVTNNGHSWSYGMGMRLGWLGTFFDDRLSFGAAYGSKVYMSRFRQYSGLFADGGEFDIPENYVVGMAVKPYKKLTIAADIQRINYSNVESVGTRHPTTSLNDPCTRPIGWTGGCLTPGATANTPDQALGAENSWGFGWTDQTAYKLGFNYELNQDWTIRAGVNYGKSPVPDDQLLFNLLAPAITEKFFTVGATYNFKGVGEINMGYVRAPRSGQTCEVSNGCKTMLTQNPGEFVAAKLEYHALGVAFGMKF